MPEIYAEWLHNPKYLESHRRALEKKARRNSDSIAQDALSVLAAWERQNAEIERLRAIIALQETPDA